MAADEGPRAADQAFDDGRKQAGGGNRNKEKAEAGAERREHSLRKARRGRSCDRGNAEEDEAQWIKKPARKAEIGDLLERLNEPARQMPRPLARRAVEQEHRSDRG